MMMIVWFEELKLLTSQRRIKANRICCRPYIHDIHTWLNVSTCDYMRLHIIRYEIIWETSDFGQQNFKASSSMPVYRIVSSRPLTLSFPPLPSLSFSYSLVLPFATNIISISRMRVHMYVLVHVPLRCKHGAEVYRLASASAGEEEGRELWEWVGVWWCFDFYGPS